MNKKRRIWAVLLCLLITLSITALPVSAAGTTNAEISAMNDYAFNAYKILCRIAIPLAIVSLAFCGFKILGSIFFDMGQMDMSRLKKQIWYTVAALLVLLFLPRVMGWAIDQLKATGWKPEPPR